MVICPQCNIEHHREEEFCRKCGKFLLTVEDPSPEREEVGVKLICPKCQVLYQKGNYCKKCGSLLIQRLPSQEPDTPPLRKKSVKGLSKQWLRLFEEKRELETCMSKLETQRDKISSDVLDPLSVCYHNRLKLLSPRHQEIETGLESIKRKTLEEIDFLVKELKPIQKRLEEFQILNKSGAVTNADFGREKKEMRKEIKSRERSLKKHRQILSLLPNKMGGSLVSYRFTGNLFRPLTWLIVSGTILLMVAGGYFLWQGRSQDTRPIPKGTITPPTPSPALQNLYTMIEDHDVEKIRSLFENIKQANLQKNIDLFMSCFSRDFKDMEGKRRDTLKMWENFEYLNLSFDLKNQTISGDNAHIRLEWLVRTSQKMSGQLQDGKTVLDVKLKKEDGCWKIRETKSVN
jgi:DNA-directed RNA polymerase subunit M/transcription elongation factor TFIIS